MTFESAFGSCGKFIDGIITWHLGLPLTFQVFLYGIYVIFIGFWIMRMMPHEGPL